MFNWLRRLFEPSGQDRSRDFNRQHGKWQVKYRDGQLSEPMCRDVAENYAAIFGGTVMRLEPRESHA